MNIVIFLSQQCFLFKLVTIVTVYNWSFSSSALCWNGSVRLSCVGWWWLPRENRTGGWLKEPVSLLGRVSASIGLVFRGTQACLALWADRSGSHVVVVLCSAVSQRICAIITKLEEHTLPGMSYYFALGGKHLCRCSPLCLGHPDSHVSSSYLSTFPSHSLQLYDSHHDVHFSLKN